MGDGRSGRVTLGVSCVLAGVGRDGGGSGREKWEERQE